MPVFVLLNGAAALVAVLVATGGGLSAGPAASLLEALCAYLLLVHLIVLASGFAAHLTVAGAAIPMAAALIAATWLRLRTDDPAHRGIRAGDTPATFCSLSASPSFAPAEAFPVIAAVAAGLLWAWPHLWEATRLWIWDDYTYHMVYPALWLREHAIAAVEPVHAFTMQAWYPLGASVVAAWFMLPFHGGRGEALAWVSLTGPLYAGIAICAMAALMARLGCRPGAWAMPAVLLLTSRRIDVMASSFSDADLAVAAALFAAFAFAVPRNDADELGGARRDTWFAGLTSGLALGIKVSAMIPALVIFAMVAWRRAARPEGSPGSLPRRGWRMARAAAATGLVFAGCWAITAGYWYARNLIHTGNPVYPAAFLFWPGTSFPETTLREYAARWGFARTVRDALAVYLNWPPYHAIAAVLGLIALAGWLAWRGRAAGHARACFGIGALAITGAILFSLPSMPFSAGNAMTFRSGFVHWDSMRYVALLPILGWTALGFALDAGAGAGRRRALIAVIVTSLALLASTQPALHPPALLLAIAVATVAISTVPSRPRRFAAGAPARTALRAGAAAVLLMALIVWRHDAKSRLTAESIYREPLFGGAAAALDRAGPGTRVAVFGDQWIFPAFGGGDHLSPVRLDRNGHPASAPIRDAMYPGPLEVDSVAFLANLRAAHVGLVAVIYLPHPGRSSERPSQEAALRTSGGARLAYRNDAVTIWRIDELASSR